MPFSNNDLVSDSIPNVGNELEKRNGFGFETLDEDTVKEGHEGLDRLERSLYSSLC